MKLNIDAFYRMMIEQVRDIILVVDAYGRILYANQAATHSYGYSLAELKCMRIHDLRSPETQIAIDEQLVQAQSDGILFRTVHLGRTGKKFPVEVSSRRLCQSNETVISIIRDISENVAMENATRKSEEKYRILSEELTASKEELKKQLDELQVRGEAISRQNIILASLHDTALKLLTKVELSNVLTLIVSNTSELLGTDNVYVDLVEHDKGVFCRKTGLGYYANEVGRVVKFNEGLSGAVYQTGELVVAANYCEWELSFRWTIFRTIAQRRRSAVEGRRQSDRVIRCSFSYTKSKI